MFNTMYIPATEHVHSTNPLVENNFCKSKKGNLKNGIPIYLCFFCSDRFLFLFKAPLIYPSNACLAVPSFFLISRNLSFIEEVTLV